MGKTSVSNQELRPEAVALAGVLLALLMEGRCWAGTLFVLITKYQTAAPILATSNRQLLISWQPVTLGVYKPELSSQPVSPLQDSREATPGVKPSHLLCITVEEVGGPTTTTPPSLHHHSTFTPPPVRSYWSLHLHLHLPPPSSVMVIQWHTTLNTALLSPPAIVLLPASVLSHYSQAWSPETYPKRSQTGHHFHQHFIRIDHGWLFYLFSLFLPLTTWEIHITGITVFQVTPLSLYPVPPLGTLNKMTQTWDT